MLRTYGHANDVIFVLDMDTGKYLKIQCEEYYIQSNSLQSNCANDHAMIVKDRNGMTRHILYEKMLKKYESEISVPEDIMLLTFTRRAWYGF